jgi:hypothetical protein
MNQFDRRMNMPYTLQADRNGNMIICHDQRKRNGYTIIARGGYVEMILARAMRTIKNYSEA